MFLRFKSIELVVNRFLSISIICFLGFALNELKGIKKGDQIILKKIGLKKKIDILNSEVVDIRSRTDRMITGKIAKQLGKEIPSYKSKIWHIYKNPLEIIIKMK